MSIGNRIKQLRRNLAMTQQEFASRIGVKRNTIANYEVGRNSPVDSVVSLICREFNINEEWLRTGNGEMRALAPCTALDALVEERGLSRSAYIVIEKFLDLSPALQDGIIDYFTEVVKALNGNTDNYTSSEPAVSYRHDAVDCSERTMSREELHAELDRQLDLEEKAEERSSALADIG